MKSQKEKANKFVNSVTNFTQMRFTPSHLVNEKKDSRGAQLVNSIKELIPWRSNIPSNDSLESTLPSNMVLSKNYEQQDTYQNSHGRFFHQLKYFTKLTMEHVMVGNKNQVDVIGICQSTRSYLDAEYLWSLSNGHPIDLLTSEMRKCIIILGNKKEKQLWIYRYEQKNMKKKAELKGQISLTLSPQEIFFLKDQLAIIFEDKIQLYHISPENQISKPIRECFKLKSGMKFFKAPHPIETTANIFFYDDGQDEKSTFTLWLIQIELKSSSIVVKEPQKIYEIKKSLKKKLILKNFSKETFLMNLGAEILAFKKGYMIDSVSISVSIDHSILKYIGHERLIHVSDKRIQIYEFKLNTSTKPYRIKTSPLDSISIRTPNDSMFLNVIQVFNENILIGFQVRPKLNKRKNGEINYWLALTQPISLSQKIDILFPRRKFLSMSQQELEDHCDMARKMGMSNKQIFIQLWNRSNRKEEDFGLLLSTRDYKSIRGQIVRLLKKNSLTFSEIYKLERSSLDILKQDVVTSNCTTSIFNGFISSVFLKKKLEYYRDYNLCDRQKNSEGQILMVNIKVFNVINELHLQTHFIELVKELCQQKKKNKQKIRLFLSTFKYPLRFVYKDLLSKIITIFKQDFIILLENIPEILPYKLNEEEKKVEMNYAPGFFHGIYGELLAPEDQENYTLEKITTVDNKEIIQSAIKDIWFKRSFLTGHCLISEPEAKIQENFQYISSKNIFYFVINQVVELQLKSSYRKKLFNYLETKYKGQIGHLEHRINLRYLIYDYFQRKNIILKGQDGNQISFKTFLSLTDDQLFFFLFEIEKERKGFLLFEIKPIYQENSDEGSSFFNNALLNYFKDPVSEISDIKYLLNRINNEKREFHSNHQEMYRILVEAMTYKLMIGTGDNIPLSEIIIYIENIPFERNNQILEKLTVINDLNDHLDLLNEAKIGMSVKEIINNPHKLMSKLIDYYLLEKQKINNQSTKVLQISYRTLANLQFLHSTIYRQDEQPPFYIFFIFLTKLIQNPNMIPYAKGLIHDEFLSKEFNYDETVAESLVIYMYKMTMSENPQFSQNEAYLKKLISLLPDGNEIKDFIICEFEYSVIFASDEYKVEYPLGVRHSTPGLSELQFVLHKLTGSKILGIDVEKLYELMKRLQQLSRSISQTISTFEDEQKSMIYTSLLRQSSCAPISKKQIYEVFILRLLELQKIKQCIGYIEKCLDIQKQESDIILPFIFLSEIGGQLNHQCKQLFFQASNFYFNDPITLFGIIKQYVLAPLNSKQKNEYLKKQVQKGQLEYKGFNIENKLLDQNLIQIAIQDGLENKLFANFQKTYHHLLNSRAEFNHLPYSFIYSIILNQPYLLSKFLLCSKRHLKIRSFRLILTYLTKEKSFNSLNVLELGYRIFLIVMFMMKEEASLQSIVSKYFVYPLDMDLPDTIQCGRIENFDYFHRLQHSAHAFREEKQKKISKLAQQISLEEKQPEQVVAEHRKKLLHPELIEKQEAIEYSSVSEESEQSQDKNLIVEKKKAVFNVQNQMKKVIEAGKRKKSFENPDDHFNVFAEASNHSDDLEQAEQEQLMHGEENFGNQFVIRINPKGSQSKLSGSQASHQNQSQRQSSNADKEVKNKEALLTVGQKPENSKVKEIIKSSALSSQGDPSVNPEERDGLQNITFPDINSIQNDLEKLDFKSFSIDKNNELSKGSSEQNRYENKMPDEKSPTTPTKEKAKKQQAYQWFDGLPSVEQIGRELYHANLLAIQKSKNPLFKIKLLSKYEKHPEFNQYMLNIINYIYKESTSSSLTGVIRLIEFLIETYKLNVDKRNLHIWVRAENMQQKYELGFPMRILFPITTIFQPNTTSEDIFNRIIDQILLHIDDINIFKIAKLIALAFQTNEYELQVIYRYFLRLMNEKEAVSSKDFEYEREKMQALIDKMTPEFINLKFHNLYEAIQKNSSKAYIKEFTVEKMRKKGKKDQKLKFFTFLAQKEPEYGKVLASLQRF